MAVEDTEEESKAIDELVQQIETGDMAEMLAREIVRRRSLEELVLKLIDRITTLEHCAALQRMRS